MSLTRPPARPVLAVLATATILVAATACGGSSDTNSDAGPKTTDRSQSATTTPERVAGAPAGFSDVPTWHVTTDGSTEVIGVTGDDVIVKEYADTSGTAAVSAYALNDGHQSWRTPVPDGWQDAEVTMISEAIALSRPGAETEQLGTDGVGTDVQIVSAADGTLAPVVTVPGIEDAGIESEGALFLDSGAGLGGDSGVFVFSDGSTYDTLDGGAWHLQTPVGDVWASEERWPVDPQSGMPNQLSAPFFLQNTSLNRALRVSMIDYGYAVQVIDTGTKSALSEPQCGDAGLNGFDDAGVTVSPGRQWAAVGVSAVDLTSGAVSCDAAMDEVQDHITVVGINDEGTVYGSVTDHTNDGEDYFFLDPGGEPQPVDASKADGSGDDETNLEAFTNAGALVTTSAQLALLPRSES